MDNIGQRQRFTKISGQNCWMLIVDPAQTGRLIRKHLNCVLLQKSHVVNGLDCFLLVFSVYESAD